MLIGRWLRVTIALLALIVVISALWLRDHQRLSRQIEELKESNRLFGEILRTKVELQAVQKHLDSYSESFSTIEIEPSDDR